VFMVSAAGGIDIEEVAAKTPEKIKYHGVDVRYGLQPYEAMQLGFFLYSDIKLVRAAAKLMQQLYAAFMATGCSLAEINPLVVTPQGEIIAVDGKMVVDDNELERRPDIEALRDDSSEAQSEVDARKHSLTFIKLEGDVGCVVNGAGLAMATMDLVKYYGGEPANFLDIGGGARADKVAAAMRLILGDPKVDSILVNIFGGITRGDEVARGLIEARSLQERNVPMVVRIVGTNADEAARLLTEAHFETAATLDEAAEKAVAASTVASSPA
ncbi:MAG: succinate--CoA ligase subunit beta, partial [Chloroflexota bacterium]|nr:succinate--CoA ligase subunit beta [Chloroflexota bacterium]